MASSRSLGQLTLDLVAKTSNFTGPLDKASREFDSRMKGIEKQAKILGAAIGVAATAAAGAIAYWTSQTITAAVEVEKLATLANTTTDVFQRWAVGANTAGISQEKLADILKDTQDKIGDFVQTGGGAMLDFFERVAPAAGVTAEQFRSLSGPDALQLYVSSLEKANLSQSDMIFFMEAIASDSALLLPLLRDNGAAMGEYADEAENLGAIMSGDLINSAQAAREQLTRLSLVKQGLINRIVEGILPALTSMTNQMVETGMKTNALDKIARATVTGIKLLTTAGVIVTGVFNALGEQLGGAAAAIVQFFSGNFSEALNIAQNTTSDFAGNIAGTIATVRSIWDESASEVAASAEENGAKLSAPFTRAEKNVKDSGKKIVDEAARIYKRIEDQIARIQRDVQTFFMSDEQVTLFDLGADGADPEQLARAERLLEVRKNLRMEEEARQNLIKREERQQGVLDDLNLEIEALGKSAEWIATRNALIDAGVTAESDMGHAISETVRQLYEQGQAIDDQIELFDTFRGAASNALSDVVSGTKSVKEAFKDMLDTIVERINQIVADKLIEQLFGAQGTTQTGSQGGWISTLIGAFFGGGRATGGGVSSGKFYEVGENDSPELLMAGGRQYLIPGNQGSVRPMGNGGGASMVNNFNFAAPASPKTQTQVAAKIGFEVRRAQRFGG